MARYSTALTTARSGFRTQWRLERERGSLGWTARIAWIYVAVWVLSTIGYVWQDIFSKTVSVTLSVQSFWPQLPAGSHVENGPQNVVGGGFTSADVSVDGLGWNVRGWLIAAHVLLGIVNIVIGLALRYLVRRVKSGEPFRAELGRLFLVCAIVIMVGGMAWQVCLSVASTGASYDTLGTYGVELPSAAGYDDPRTMLGIPMPAPGIRIDFWPIGVGIVLVLLSRLVRIGERLHRETEGLV